MGLSPNRLIQMNLPASLVFTTLILDLYRRAWSNDSGLWMPYLHPRRLARCLRDASLSHLVSRRWEGDDDSAAPDTGGQHLTTPSVNTTLSIAQTGSFSESTTTVLPLMYLLSLYLDWPRMAGDRPTSFHHDIGRDVGILNSDEENSGSLRGITTRGSSLPSEDIADGVVMQR
ncbi:hypothetical protein BDZ89DRAFT_1135486 [Hymenopellis radicata]|nr:hypothetical protein BDZ89DRAFT_1135481 [Hymenopellis radicata]KAF9025321.1 hypothetical protein BDZ89DRAFT_1135486 [Hymenopellis radicata]